MNTTRYIPENSTPITNTLGSAIVYTYTAKDGKPAGIAYIGKSAKKQWHYRFTNEAQRDAQIARLFENVKAQDDYKASRKAEKQNFKHSLKVGDVLHSSWGYEQTNVEFYQIVATTKKTVTFREICQNRTRTGHDSGVCSPRLNEWAEDSKEHTRTVKPGYQGNPIVNFSEEKGGYMKMLTPVDRAEIYWSDGY